MMRSCRYTSVKSHCKVVPNVLYMAVSVICVTWLLVVNGIYSGGFVCCVGLAYEKCLLDGSIYLSVKFKYVSFPIGLHSFHSRNLSGVVGLCSSWFD